MAIDRGPWNALVDDDGSNLVGSVWNKDKIKTTILDPVDVAISSAGWIVPPYDPANYYTIGEGTTWTVPEAYIVNESYIVIGKTLFFKFGNDAAVIGGAPIGLVRKMFGGYQIKRNGFDLFTLAPATPCYAFYPINTSELRLFKDIHATPWSAGAMGSFRVSGSVEIV